MVDCKCEKGWRDIQAGDTPIPPVRYMDGGEWVYPKLGDRTPACLTDRELFHATRIEIKDECNCVSAKY